MFRRPTLLRLQREFLCVLEQRKKLELYEPFVSGVDSYLTFCESTRRDFLNGARQFTTSLGRIDHAMVKSIQGLLRPVPQEEHEILYRRAKRKAPPFARGLSIVQPIARTEVVIRQLHLICLRWHRLQFPSAIRLPDWSWQMDAAQFRYDLAVEEWKEVRSLLR